MNYTLINYYFLAIKAIKSIFNKYDDEDRKDNSPTDLLLYHYQPPRERKRKPEIISLVFQQRLRNPALSAVIPFLVMA